MADEVKSTSNAAKWRLFAIVGVLSILADQASKIWARSSLPVVGTGTGPSGSCVNPWDYLPAGDHVHALCYGTQVDFISGFWTWRFSINPGSAFGLFGSLSVARVLLSIVGVGAVIGMVYMLKKSRNDQRILHWALALVAGGAIGNLIDRIYYGGVTDFISWDLKFMMWPTFNVADIVLVVGVGLMFIDIQKEGKREKAAKQAKKEAKAAKLKAAGLV
ncbi:MAG: signal peptidase II, partial [Kofleriaceae bacterium]